MYGCRQSGTCNKCLKLDCATCENFNNTCTSTISDPCLSGFTFDISSKAVAMRFVQIAMGLILMIAKAALKACFCFHSFV